MTTKTVIAADYREWQVSRRIEWTTPAVGDEFEHDVDAGNGAGVLILGTLVFFWLVLVVWVPGGVVFPWFYWLVVIVGLVAIVVQFAVFGVLGRLNTISVWLRFGGILFLFVVLLFRD